MWRRVKVVLIGQFHPEYEFGSGTGRGGATLLVALSTTCKSLPAPS